MPQALPACGIFRPGSLKGVLTTRGLLITLEGIDGCGKSTQAERLNRTLEKSGVPFVPVREPGGTEVGEDIRQILLDNRYSISLQTELMLYMAARSELTGQVIIPALQAGKVVLCDRFTDSTLAYQGYGGGADLNLIRFLNHKATGGIIPDLTILLDITVEEAAERRGASADRMESKDIRYHQRVRLGYLEIARREPQRVKILDAAGDAEEQGRQIWQLVQACLPDVPK
jgi:dTMP kinase